MRLNRYGVRINVRHPQNGDSESSHGQSKTTVDRALELHGSRDFASRDDNETFLRQVLDKRNTARRERHAEEAALLRPLLAASLESGLCLAVIGAIDRLVHRNRDASRAIRACGRHGDVLPAQQKERASRAVAPLAFAFRARTIWNGSAAAWQSFVAA